MIKFLLALFTSFYACTGLSDSLFIGGGTPAKVVNVDNHFLYLDGVITGQTIAPLQEALEKIITAGGSKRAVTILINSPGGGVVAGMSFINRMQTLRALGTEINCYVLDVAASMAFQILTQCTTRYTMPTSFLLWHGVRMGTYQPITAELARQMAADLERMDFMVMRQLASTLSMKDDDIRSHFRNETLWSGAGLHFIDPYFISIEDAYPELMSKLDTAVRTEEPMFFLQLDGMIYIWESWARKAGLIPAIQPGMEGAQ